LQAARPPRDGREFLADVESEQPALRRHRQYDCEARIAGENADLDRALRVCEPHQHLHELALVGRDLHVDLRVRCGLGTECSKPRILAQRVREQVLVSTVVERERPVRH